MKRIVTAMIMLATLVFGGDKSIIVPKNSYQIEKFDSNISSVKVSDSKKVRVRAIYNEESSSYNELEIFAKEYGDAQILITLEGEQKKIYDITVIKNLSSAKKMLQNSQKDASLEYRDGKIVLEGAFESHKDKEYFLSILEASDVNTTRELIDLSSIKKPPVMVRAKLYVVELTNKLGHDYQSGLAVSSLTSKNLELSPSIDAPGVTPIMELLNSSVTLSGGLTAVAGVLGSKFNLQGALSFLKTNGLAKILDETTVSVLENREGKFHAGGTVYVTTQSISSSGTANTELRPINYGILLTLRANTIMDGGFINMTIHTESSKLDNVNKINQVPGILTKRVDTNVIAQNGGVIVLGGMINSEDSNAVKKMPILGDIPILGTLFRSESFIKGQSELAFFILPEIIDASEIKDSRYMQESREKKEKFSEAVE